MTQHDPDDGFPGEDSDDVPEWTDHVMATIAAEVRRRRKELGMSAQDLADKCADLGHPIPRNVIANMESGRRANLPLVDVIVLAEALRTFPICLLYPVGYVQRVQRLPFEQYAPTWEVMHWFSGDPEQRDLLTEDGMLRNFRAHTQDVRAALAALKGEKRERWNAESAATPAERDEALRAQSAYAERAFQAKYRLRTARAFVREDGGTPPPLPAELADVDPPDVGADTDANTIEENGL